MCVIFGHVYSFTSFPGRLSGKNPPANAGHVFEPRVRKIPGRRIGQIPVKYSGQGNPRYRGAWQATTVHRVANIYTL